jgi:hypothetical protein
MSGADHQNRSHEVVTIVTAFTVVSILVVILRFVSRIKFMSSLGRDDWAIMGSLVSHGREREV